MREAEKLISIKYIDSLGLIIVMLDTQGNIQSINQKGAEILGVDKENIIGENWFDHFVEEDKKSALSAYFAFIKTLSPGETNKNENYIVTKNNEKKLILWSNVLLLDDEGNISGILASGEDITEMHNITEVLKQSENRFRSLFEQAPFGYQSLDENGCFIEVNQKWLDLFGYKKEEVIGKWFGDFLTPTAKSNFKKRFEIFKARGQIHSEFPLKAKDGHFIQVGFDGEIGYSKEKEFKQTHCLVQDITEINIAQQKLVSSEKKYRELVDNMPLGMLIQEPIYNNENMLIDFKILQYNQEFCNQFGLTKVDLTSKTTFEIFPDFKESLHLRYEKVVNSEKAVVFETYLKDYNKHFKIIAYRMKDDENLVVISEDITEKKCRDLELENLSKYDFLTNLSNRRTFVKSFKDFNTSENYPLAVIMMDVNGLKIINDAFGHNTGDIVLKHIADTLREIFPKDDVIARIGGDEFCILMKKTGTEKIEKLKKKLKRELTKIVVSNMELSLAVGYDFVDEKNNRTLDEVLKEAENHMYRYKISEGISVRNKAIKAIFNTLNEKYDVERVHSERVSKLSKAIGIKMGFNQENLRELELSGLFHDIGKISIPDAILNKPSKLTKEEYEIIKKHPEFSYQILRAADEYSDLAITALYHHERWDGKGYPKGLKGEEIPLFSRIINVADAFEAMTSQRPYKKVISKDDAVKELIRCSGTQFDSKIVDIFVNEVLR